MMRKALVFTCLLALGGYATDTWAEDRPIPTPRRWGGVDDTTLEYYLSRSDAVVEGTVTSCDSNRRWDATGLTYCQFDAAVSNVIMGDLKTDEALRLSVALWHNTPGPTPGRRYIIFLNSKAGLADMWFGIQPYEELMASRLRVLAANQAGVKAVAPPAAFRGVSVIVDYEKADRALAELLYQYLGALGMQQKELRTELGSSSRVVFYKHESQKPLAVWLRDTHLVLRDFSIKQLSAGDSREGIVVKLW